MRMVHTVHVCSICVTKVHNYKRDYKRKVHNYKRLDGRETVFNFGTEKFLKPPSVILRFRTG